MSRRSLDIRFKSARYIKCLFSLDANPATKVKQFLNLNLPSPKYLKNNLPNAWWSCPFVVYLFHKQTNFKTMLAIVLDFPVIPANQSTNLNYFDEYVREGYDTVSDGEDLSIEWDGMYGRHWVSYNSEQELIEAMRRNDIEMFNFGLQIAKEKCAGIFKVKYICKECGQIHTKIYNHENGAMPKYCEQCTDEHNQWLASTKNSIGNLFPELAQLTF